MESDTRPTGTLLLRYFDVVLLVAAAPIMLLIGVSATGYGAGAGAWIIVRALGEVVERVLEKAPANQQITIRLGFLIGRLFALAITVIVVRKTSGQAAGLTALLVIVFAYTISFFLSFANRPRSSK